MMVIFFKFFGYVDYGWINKDWMFFGLVVYKYIVFKRGEGDKRVVIIKGGSNFKYWRVFLGWIYLGKLGDLEICCLKWLRMSVIF